MVGLIRPDCCRFCKYAEPVANVRKGEPEFECHGSPPQVVAFVVPSQAGPQLQVQTTFPRVMGEWNCGQWRAKIAQPAG